MMIGVGDGQVLMLSDRRYLYISSCCVPDKFYELNMVGVLIRRVCPSTQHSSSVRAVDGSAPG